MIIDRLNKIGDPEEVWRWIRDAKGVRGDLVEFLDLVAVTGLRLVEAVECFNLIVELTRQRKIESYYVRDAGVLEHFRFKEKFIRRNKKVFVSFVQEALIKQIGLSAKISSAHAVSASFRRNGFTSRFSDVREAQGTFMIRFLKKEEIDFLHGRVSTSTFTKHYFNPALIGDLRERAFKGVNEILEKVKI